MWKERFHYFYVHDKRWTLIQHYHEVPYAQIMELTSWNWIVWSRACFNALYYYAGGGWGRVGFTNTFYKKQNPPLAKCTAKRSGVAVFFSLSCQTIFLHWNHTLSFVAIDHKYTHYKTCWANRWRERRKLNSPNLYAISIQPISIVRGICTLSGFWGGFFIFFLCLLYSVDLLVMEKDFRCSQPKQSQIIFHLEKFLPTDCK